MFTDVCVSRVRKCVDKRRCRCRWNDHRFAPPVKIFDTSPVWEGQLTNVWISFVFSGESLREQLFEWAWTCYLGTYIQHWNQTNVYRKVRSHIRAAAEADRFKKKQKNKKSKPKRRKIGFEWCGRFLMIWCAQQYRKKKNTHIREREWPRVQRKSQVPIVLFAKEASR